jgi:protease I
MLPDDFEQVEFTEPRKALQDAGADAVVIAPKEGKVQGMKHDEKADRFDVDMRLDAADPEDVDAVMLPGGALNADFLRAVKKAQEFVRQIDLDKKRSATPLGCWYPRGWPRAALSPATTRSRTTYGTPAPTG